MNLLLLRLVDVALWLLHLYAEALVGLTVLAVGWYGGRWLLRRLRGVASRVRLEVRARWLVLVTPVEQAVLREQQRALEARRREAWLRARCVERQIRGELDRVRWLERRLPR